ncbi:MAG: hypothetical protein L6V95_07660 [Candidatus Melainabacteria bacterium]|nr:MAG: hypothetical protein L6V95_07660 [Candidatus Melainabacteria bacterium]
MKNLEKIDPICSFHFSMIKIIIQLCCQQKEEHSQIYNKTTGAFNDEFLNSLVKQYENKGYIAILPIDEKGIYLRWRWGYDSCFQGIIDKIIFVRETNKRNI